jgi:hypothetical protein
MPFCPNCGYEYGFQVSQCPDCREKLVHSLDPDPSQTVGKDVRFAPMPELPGRVFAEMVKGALEEKDIHSYIRSDGVSDAYGIVGTGMITKGFRLFVPEDKLEECLEIQRQMMDGK